MASRCDFSGLQELIKNSKGEHTESESFEMIEAVAKKNPSSTSFLTIGDILFFWNSR